MAGRISEAKRQELLLDTGFLDLTGDSKLDFVPVSLDTIAGTLADIAIQFADLAREKLNSVDRVATGALSDSIIPTEVEIFGNVYQVQISVNEYYKFVDKGVKGWASSEKAHNSPYQFKNTPPGKKMMTEIRKWIIREGLKGKIPAYKGQTGIRRARKRHSITNTSQSTAYAISAAIKHNGLKTTNFWTNTVNEMEGRIREEFAKALKIDVVKNLTNKK